MTRITIGRAGSDGLRSHLLDSLFRLRHRVFHERLGWEVRSEQGREHDEFDRLDPWHLVAHTGGSAPQAVGCCRFLPSLGPNMLRDVFPHLLDGRPAPAHLRIWEVSRFAVDDAYTRGKFGFSDVPADMLRAVVRFASAHRIEALVGVTSAAFARMLDRIGFRVELLGRPRRIGRVQSLAFRLPIDDATRHAVCGTPVPVALRRAA